MSGFSKSRIQRIVVNNAIQAQQATIASTSTSATSASYALTASYAMNGGSGSGGTTTGSFTGSFTGSLLGTASYAITASYAMNGGGSINTSSLVTTSSFNAFTSSIQGQVTSLTNATSSYVLNNQTSSFVTNSQTASFVTNNQTSSFITTSSFNSFTGSYNTGSFTGSFTGSLLGTSSYTQVTDKINVIDGSSLAAEFYPVIVDDLGNMIPYLDTSFNYTPSTNQLTVGGITSSLFGTSSWAQSSSRALTASFLPVGTYAITSSWANNALTASSITALNQNVLITGSLTVVTGSAIELQVLNTGVHIGSVIGDNHTITGSLFTSGSVTLNTGSLTLSSGPLTLSSGPLSVSTPNPIQAPFTLTALNNSNTFYAGQITATSGMQGFRVNTNGQAQYLARSSTHTDRELRFQMFSDGNTYFGQQGLSGTITSDLIIRTSADAGTNNGAVRFSLMGTNKMAITPAGIKIGNQATALSAASELDVSGSFTMTGSMIYASPISPGFNGEIVRFGSGTLTRGQLYFLSSSGTWSLANANSTGSSTGMLGLALGSSPTTNGLLIRGLAASSSYSYGTGAVIYMATSSGAMTATSPSSSNHVVRVMGYQTTIANTIYFDPDKTWVTLA
jgi:hypothetical protein